MGSKRTRWHLWRPLSEMWCQPMLHAQTLEPNIRALWVWETCRKILLLGLNHWKGYIGSGETQFCLNPFSDPNDHYHSWPTRPNFGITGRLLPGLQCHSLLRVSSWWWVSKGRCCPLDHCFACCRGCQKSAKVREKYSVNTYRERLPGILNEPQKSCSQAGLARSKRLNSNTKKLF